MNVLNVSDVERELFRVAARAYSDHVRRWFLTVARNHILASKLSEKDLAANFLRVTLRKTTRPDFHSVTKEELPVWALFAMERREKIMWFDNIQPRKREFWKLLDIILVWFNNWKQDDPRLPRVDRISFPVAVDAAVLWYKNVSENIWSYVTDKPVVVKAYEHGYRWVKLVSALQFEREGQLMRHCVGNGNYYNQWRMTSNREYFSLRDQFNNPHVTMEVCYESSNPVVRKGAVSQCKGNSNKKADVLYQPYIKRFIEDMKWEIHSNHSFID